MAKRKPSDPAAVLRRAADLLMAAASQVEDEGAESVIDDISTAAELVASARKNVGRARRQRSDGDGRASTGEGGAREALVGSLDALGVPAAPREVALVAAARFHMQIEPKTFGSLRRDERRAWTSPRTVRPTYVCAALDAKRFVAYRGLLALSSWDLTRRIIGALSPRVDHLRATQNLAQLLVWLRDVDDEAAKRLERIVRRYASTIPGAMGTGEELDPLRVDAATKTELELLEPNDIVEREEAAERARKQLDEEALTWGAPFRVVQGAGADGGSGGRG